MQRGAAASTNGKLSLHASPGDAPDLNPDELAWRHVKRTGVARNLRRAGKTLSIRVDQPLRDMQKNRRVVRSLFQAPSVAYISDGRVTRPVGLADAVTGRGIHCMACDFPFRIKS